MLKIALRCSASVFAFCICSAAPTHVVPSALARGIAYRPASVAPTVVTLYDQNSADSGYAIVSTNFTDGSFSTYNSYGADDFVIPAGHKWKVKEVDVTGSYMNGQGPATSENVLFYSNVKGLPGTLTSECDNIKGTEMRGSFAIKIPKTCRVSLRGGKTYWVSVVANMYFPCCGAWAWETRNIQNGKPATWENPNNGSETGCKTWETLVTCFGSYGEGPDFMFTLKGEDVTG